MAEGFTAKVFLIRDVLRAEVCAILNLLASSWFLLCTTYFGLISVFKGYCFKRIDQDGGCLEKVGPCEEICDKKGRDKKKAGESLDERAGDNKNAGHEDFQEDDALLPVEGFRHAAVEPEVIDFSFDDQTDSENDSPLNAEMKAFRGKGGIDEAFSSNKEKWQSSFSGRFLKVRPFGSPTAYLDINVGGNWDSPTDFSSSVGSNRDMFSDGDTSDSSFEEDDFLTEKDFIWVKPRPISDYLSLAQDLREESKSPDFENSDEKGLEFSYEFLGEKDEAYERLELLSVHAPSLPSSTTQSEEEDGDDEISIGSMILDTSDLEAEHVDVLHAKEGCGLILQSYQGIPDLVVDDDPPISSTIHEFDFPKKQISEGQIRNHDTLTKDAHYACPNSYDSLQYQGAHDQSSPENQGQSPQLLQKDRPDHTFSSNEVNPEDESHLNIVGQVEDTVNHVSEGPLESTSDQNDPIIHDLLKSEDTNDTTPDPLTEPQDVHPGTSVSVGENDDNNLQNSAESISERWEERRDYEDEEEDELEALLEHQKMVEKLKMEMRRARGRELPTILEESEWPKAMDDLKPWNINNSKLMAAVKEDPLEEMQRFRKSYTDRMRKFDILNHQKTSSIGFLKLADPIQSSSALRAAIPALTSVLSQNFRRSRAKKSEMQPSPEFMRELRVDLETVYVGQLCLSWEYLHWQYTRFRDMLDADPDCRGNFRRAADEFQTFLVLLTRFMEDEKFKGPRVDNYVKNRCVQRSLLLVPLIKEEKSSKLDEGEEDTSVDDLVEIMEECLRTFWDFVRRDRDEAGTILKGLIGSQTELQDPTDAELFANIQASFHKKEKRLKDLQRTGNCLVKRLQKQQQGGWMDESLFFSLVDMKLVGRVLRMSRVRSDHLEWCQSKLLRVTFRGRKLVRDPSFLLFPS
ncbi:hypothetical protein EJ110_NYTH18767 [Nymphaea thermarum]|nr:hypothetical protein EJ110_NYTH18767 [Nymphaea thermarum]